MVKQTVALALPTLGQIYTQTARCLISLLQTSQAECHLLTTEGISLIPCARNILAAQFLQSGAEYLLSIDSDMVFPCGDSSILARSLQLDLGTLPATISELLEMNALDQLLSHQKLVIGADYLRKSQTLRDHNRASSVTAYHSSQTQWQGYEFHLQKELLPCTYLATGFLLVHRDVFIQLQEAYPDLRYRDSDWGYLWGYYNPLIVEESYLPEDVAFCHRLREQGLELWLDPKVTLGHLGTYAYNRVSSALQTISKVRKRSELCLITPNWFEVEQWGTQFLNFLKSAPSDIQEIYLYCDPLQSQALQVADLLADLLLQADFDLANCPQIWLDERPAWELEWLFAEARYWYEPCSSSHFKVISDRQQALPLQQ